MSSNNNSSSAKLPPLWFFRALFADYWTTLESRVHQDDDCDRASGSGMHTQELWLIRSSDYNASTVIRSLISDSVLTLNPIYPAEVLIAIIVAAAAAAQMIPPLAVWWDEFREHWSVYKRAQGRIWAIAIATLQVGRSTIHTLRSCICQYGSGTALLSAIYEKEYH